MGKWTSFPRSVKLKRGETVVWSYIVYKSRAHRDRVNAKVMKDPRLANMMNPKAMPLDGKRMIYGGVELPLHALATGSRSVSGRSHPCPLCFHVFWLNTTRPRCPTSRYVLTINAAAGSPAW